MSIFKKRKPMSSTTTAAAPVMQDNPVASESSEGGVIINVVGIGTPEHWVHSNMGPQIPMPRQETIKLEEMPLKNCAVPAGWYFKEFSDPNDE